LKSDAPATAGATPSADLSDAPAYGGVTPPTNTAAAAAPAATPTTPTADSTTPTPTSGQPGAVGFSSARVAVQGALDRGQLAQALLLLSDWYDDPSLTPAESKEVETLLSQLAGSVIYEGPPAHRLEKPYIVQAGDTLDAVAQKYDVPSALLAKINGLPQSATLEPGKELKVLRGPFSAIIDLSKRKMTLMLDRRYAGKFAIELDPVTTVEEGQWKVDQKLLTPGTPSLYSQSTQPTEERSLLLANPASATGQPTILRGPGEADPLSSQSRGRVIRLKENDVNDLYDILSEGSRVTIRR
jgi:LysM repeat protein